MKSRLPATGAVGRLPRSSLARHRSWRFVAGAAVLVIFSGAVTLSFVGSAGATFPGYNGMIAFATSRPANGFSYIWVINPDGTGEQQTSTGSGAGPEWSPDGTKITFTRDVGRHQVFGMDADGSNEHQLTTDGHNDGAAWSPDADLDRQLQCSLC